MGGYRCLKIERNAIDDRRSTSEILQLASITRGRNGVYDRHLTIPSSLRPLFHPIGIQQELIKDGLREFVDISVRDVPKVCNEARTKK